MPGRGPGARQARALVRNSLKCSPTTVHANVPPGRSTRAISATVASMSGMCSKTQLETTDPNQAVGNGIAPESADNEQPVDAAVRRLREVGEPRIEADVRALAER